MKVTGGAKLLAAAVAGVALVYLFLPWSVEQKLFGVAYGIDPQRPSHTYILGRQQMPLEARKLGMFGGFLLANLGLVALGRGRAAHFPKLTISVALVGLVALMGLDGLNATLFDLGLPHAYTPDLGLRLATGLLCGVAMAALLLPAANGAAWRHPGEQRALQSWRELLALLLLAAGFFLLIDIRLPLLYYPGSVIGLGGLLLELGQINLVFVMALSRRLGSAETAGALLAPCLAALLLSFAELAFMAAVRYLTIGDALSAL